MLQNIIWILSIQIFDICPHSLSRDLKTYGVPPLANEFCLLQGVDQQSNFHSY